MAETIEDELATLGTMNVAQLRGRYAELFGESTRTRHKAWLIKRIAWRLQALAEGDLSERARSRAAELACDADLRLSPPTRGAAASANGERGTLPDGRDRRLPRPGAVLVRRYKGRALEVTVLADGFQLDGQVFRTLSAVAKAITGSHCNGYQFFRLRKQGSEP